LSVGREELVTGAGSLIIAEVGGESLIITRDEVGRLDRLLHNFKQRYLAIRDGERSHR